MKQVVENINQMLLMRMITKGTPIADEFIKLHIKNTQNKTKLTKDITICL